MNYKRVFVPNSYVHLIVVAYNRKDIFVENIELLRNSFKNAKQHFVFDIIAICVLPNHIHMILNPDNIKEYPKIITSIKYHFSKYYDVGVETPTYRLIVCCVYLNFFIEFQCIAICNYNLFKTFI